MAHARITKEAQVGGDFSAMQSLVERLRVDYTIKKGQFSLLKDDVIQLQYTVETMCGECLCGKENQLSMESLVRLRRGVADVKGTLSDLMMEIRLLQTDESPEYRYCKATLNESERRFRCQPMKNSQYHLIESIIGLRNMHDENCKAKEDLENIINRAHHQLNKLEKLLTKCGEHQPGTCGDKQQNLGTQHLGTCGEIQQHLGTCGDQQQHSGICGDKQQSKSSDKPGSVRRVLADRNH